MTGPLARLVALVLPERRRVAAAASAGAHDRLRRGPDGTSAWLLSKAALHPSIAALRGDRGCARVRVSRDPALPGAALLAPRHAAAAGPPADGALPALVPLAPARLHWLRGATSSAGSSRTWRPRDPLRARPRPEPGGDRDRGARGPRSCGPSRERCRCVGRRARRSRPASPALLSARGGAGAPTGGPPRRALGPARGRGAGARPARFRAGGRPRLRRRGAESRGRVEQARLGSASALGGSLAVLAADLTTLAVLALAIPAVARASSTAFSSRPSRSSRSRRSRRWRRARGLVGPRPRARVLVLALRGDGRASVGA